MSANAERVRVRASEIAYFRGAEAAVTGRALTANPYTITALARAWEDGWRDETATAPTARAPGEQPAGTKGGQ
jgi:ribosome modulation factor